MKVIVLIIGIVIVAIMFPMVLDAIHDSQAEVQNDGFAGCVVAAGQTDVVLTIDPFNNALTSIETITADGAGAVPIALAYVPATNTLTIGGLGADTPQAITVAYEYDNAAAYTGLSEMMNFTPMLIWVAIIGSLLFAGFGFAKSKGWM